MGNQQSFLRLQCGRLLFVPSTAINENEGNEEIGDNAIISFRAFCDNPDMIVMIRMRKQLIVDHCPYDFFNPSRVEGRLISGTGTV